MAELAGADPDSRVHRSRRRTCSRPTPTDEFLQKTYPALYAKGDAHGREARRHDSVAGLDRRIVTSAGAGDQDMPLAGRRQAESVSARPSSRRTRSPENAQSVGSYVTFGRFRALHLGRSDA